MVLGAFWATLAGSGHYTGSNCGDQPVLFIKNCKNLKGRMNGLYQEGINTKKNSLAAKSLDVLREDIIRGKIKPGERIVEEDIAEKFM